MTGKSIKLKDKIISPGIAIGKACIYHAIDQKQTATHFPAKDLDKQIALLKNAYDCAETELSGIVTELMKISPEKSGIFVAHQEILHDVEIRNKIAYLVKEEQVSPVHAVDTVFENACVLLEQVEDPIIASRTADLRDVKNRILRLLQGDTSSQLSDLKEDVIVVAHELLPSDTALLDRTHVKGIITEIGGAYSHTAIIARSYQIPTALGMEGIVSELTQGQELILDAIGGELILEPSAECISEYQEKQYVFAERQKAGEAYTNKPALTKDGRKIEIGINISSEYFGAEALDYDTIGLFRTEFLYMKRKSLPTEEEQFEIYKQVLRQAGGKAVTLRTLDIGGDKKLSYFQTAKEENPALGNRALRFCLKYSTILETQLRAALRASAYGPLQIMFPMVGSMDDILLAKAAVQQAMNQLTQEGVAYNKDIKLGVMIEIPSIALLADLVAQEVDFASIGTNDLAQYVCAADRMNSEVTTYYQPLSPAMLRLMKFVFQEFNNRKKHISVCGELAGESESGILLIGLGATSLSMNERSIPQMKAALAGITIKEANALAEDCLKLRTATEVEDKILGGHYGLRSNTIR